MSQIDYLAIRGRISIGRVLELLGYQPLSQRGPQWRGPCPICCGGDVTANPRCFSVHVGRDLFRCFRCGRAGNQLDLWAQLRRPLPLSRHCRSLPPSEHRPHPTHQPATAKSPLIPPPIPQLPLQPNRQTGPRPNRHRQVKHVDRFPVFQAVLGDTSPFDLRAKIGLRGLHRRSASQPQGSRANKMAARRYRYRAMLVEFAYNDEVGIASGADRHRSLFLLHRNGRKVVYDKELGFRSGAAETGGYVGYPVADMSLAPSSSPEEL